MSAIEKLLNLIEDVAKLGYALGLGLAVFYLILLGFKYIRGGKDVGDSHREIILIIIGIIIIVISFTIPTLIRSFIEK